MQCNAIFDLAAFYCQIPVDEQTSRYFVAEVPPLSNAEHVLFINNNTS
jgi:hypothetical protein